MADEQKPAPVNIGEFAWKELVTQGAAITLNAREVDAILSAVFFSQSAIFRLSSAVSLNGLMSPAAKQAVEEANKAANTSLKKATEALTLLQQAAIEARENG